MHEISVGKLKKKIQNYHNGRFSKFLSCTIHTIREWNMHQKTYWSRRHFLQCSSIAQGMMLWGGGTGLLCRDMDHCNKGIRNTRTYKHHHNIMIQCNHWLFYFKTLYWTLSFIALQFLAKCYSSHFSLARHVLWKFQKCVNIFPSKTHLVLKQYMNEGGPCLQWWWKV